MGYEEAWQLVSAGNYKPKKKPRENLNQAAARIIGEVTEREADEEHVDFFKAQEDSAEALEPAEEPFDLVPFLVEGAIVGPRLDPVGLRGKHRHYPQIERKLPGSSPS